MFLFSHFSPLISADLRRHSRRRISPFDGAPLELHSDAKATVGPWLTIDHSPYLRKVASQRGNQQFVTGLAKLLGPHPRAMRTDILRERFFGSMRLFRPCQVNVDRHWDALLDSPIQMRSTNTPPASYHWNRLPLAMEVAQGSEFSAN